MNNKLLLITSITLLYRESQMNDAERSSDLIRNLISKMKFTALESNLGVGQEHDIIDCLRQTTMQMCSAPHGHIYELNELMQRLRVDTGEDTSAYDALYDSMVVELDENALKRTVLNLRRTLQEALREATSFQIMEEAMYRMKFKKNEIQDTHKFFAELAQKLEESNVVSVIRDPAIINELDIDDEEAVAQTYVQVQASEVGESIMRTGWQGVNRMLQGGIRRGDEGVIGALQHNFKTGFTLTMFKQIALYNVPYMINPLKKPLLVRFTFEDSAEKNMEFLYMSLKENEDPTKKAVTIGLDPKYIAQYVKEKLRVNGYHIKIISVNPTLWTYRHICDKLLEFESQGYEVHLCMVDYLTQVPTTGCTVGPTGTDVRNMYQRIRAFCSPRKIAFITPHQLSTEAKRLTRDGATDFVKQIENKGMYALCQSLDNEVDWELYIHKEIVNGDAFLTLQRGKHRVNGILPEKYKYLVLPFYPVGAIRDDLNGPDSSRSKVGGGPIGSSNEIPDWELDTPVGEMAMAF
jgi:archaellum biogenesis ATPase FlaH